ncbi:glycosyltransferase family 4 protein [Ruegeria sp. R14_0]|uniref:glycosyltransferase family 4 protein n=1 Tax=Ruegeria sp. R14_0 TaxID=2821100 RepID=UPI001ADA5D10|nr:glycosyltransferase family 4 protein [Ruegeria sp. R14_0]MBO9447409.1 glycosyltransferase family 4 protein [Ruegeria sp. R14_0]
MTEAVFAIPGDKDQRTGGFIYEATVLRVLNEIGCKTEYLQLPGSFPNPTQDDMSAALSALRAVPETRPIILDGLVFGAIDPEGLERVRAPIIAMIHHPLGLETGLQTERAEFLLKNEAAALRHAAHIVVPSPETARVLVSQFDANPDLITIAPPGFDRPVVRKQPKHPPLILSVGLLARRKGHDTLLSALATIKDLEWQAIIVGKEHDQSTAIELYSQSKVLGLTERVTFAGELDQASLNDLFNSATLFALATRYEGYGMVLSEAMMFGLPIVSCDVGAVPETVGDAGILSSPEDALAFGANLRLLLENQVTRARLGRRSELKSMSLPSWHATGGKLASVIKSLVEKTN